MVIGEIKSGENCNGESRYEVDDECFGGKGHCGQFGNEFSVLEQTKRE